MKLLFLLGILLCIVLSTAIAFASLPGRDRD
jgi:hypothetical protein